MSDYEETYRDILKQPKSKETQEAMDMLNKLIEQHQAAQQLRAVDGGNGAENQALSQPEKNQRGKAKRRRRRH